MSSFKRLLIALILALPLVAWADGLPLVNGRYPGEVLDFSLTKEQKKVIDHYRVCQLEGGLNMYTPYVLSLTPAQAARVRKRVGFAPKRFEVFETVRGFNDAGPFWNLALRYSEDRMEIPVDLLLNDRDAREAHNVQGWERKNPCFPKLGK